MNITLTITGATAAEIKDAVLELSSQYGVTANGELVKSKPEKAKPAPVVSAKEEGEVKEPKQEGATYTLEQVRAIATEIAKGGKRPEVKALITEFGAKNIENLKEEDYAAFVTKVKAL